MPQYTFFRFEENEDSRYKGTERWVFQFVLREVEVLDEDDMIDIIENAIDDDRAGPGLWRVNESFPDSINVMHGPFRIDDDEDEGDGEGL
jgi:hypothetical protein